jgi:hypothetical protein
MNELHSKALLGVAEEEAEAQPPFAVEGGGCDNEITTGADMGFYIGDRGEARAGLEGTLRQKLLGCCRKPLDADTAEINPEAC